MENYLENKEVILSVKDLSVRFSLRGKSLHAIRGVSLDVYKGESLAIVGESGSGKSVLTKNFIGQNGTGMGENTRQENCHGNAGPNDQP